MGHFKDKTVVGITGGVGSGKSTILQVLREEFAACIIEADKVSKELMEPGGASYKAVVDLFGADILGSDGKIDVKALSMVLFSQEENPEKLSRAVHPLVVREIIRRIEAAPEKLIAYEAALPAEGAFPEICDEIWYIHVPEEIRRARLAESRGYTKEQCSRIMNNQLSEEKFREFADRIIENGGDRAETEAEVRLAAAALMKK